MFIEASLVSLIKFSVQTDRSEPLTNGAAHRYEFLICHGWASTHARVNPTYLSFNLKLFLAEIIVLLLHDLVIFGRGVILQYLVYQHLYSVFSTVVHFDEVLDFVCEQLLHIPSKCLNF